jgi:VWFA-related protein
LLLLVFGSPGAHAADPQASPAPATAFPSTIEVVNVDVVVLDKRGEPVEGLTAADFTLKEDGQPQALSSFEAVALAESAPTPTPGQQRVSTNALPPDPRERWMIVVFDDMNMSHYATPRAQQALQEFLTKGLRAGDQVMIVPTSGGAWWTGRLPQDLESLSAFVKKQQGGVRPDTSPGRIWDHEAYAIVTDRDPQALARVARRYFETNLIPEAYPQDREIAREVQVSPGLALIRSKAREVYKQSTARLRATLGALERVSAALTSLRGRKTLLLVSEGFIMDTSQREFRELVQAARQANAAIHYIDVRSPEGMLGQAGMPGGGAEFSRDIEERDTTTALAFAALEAEGARSIALDTGGSIVSGTAGLAQAMTKIAAEGRSYYLIGYTSANAKRDGKFRKIEVGVSRPDVQVRARRGYYAPKDGDERPLGKDELDPAVRAGLDAPAGRVGLPLRLTSLVFGPQPDGKSKALLVAEVDLAPLRLEARAGRYEANLRAYVVVHGRDTNSVDSQETQLELSLPADVFARVQRSGVPVRREFNLVPGRYQARLLVRDERSGLLGSVRHEFEVPGGTGLRASTPLITDAFQPADGGGAPRPVPVARRTFQAGGPLACAFEIYGAAPDPAAGGPRVSVSYSLRAADGRELLSAPARRVEARSLFAVSHLILLEIPKDADGPHELRVTIQDEAGARKLELTEPFTVMRRPS